MQNANGAQLCFDFYINESEITSQRNNIFFVEFQKKHEKFFFEENKKLAEEIALEAKNIQW